VYPRSHHRAPMVLLHLLLLPLPPHRLRKLRPLNPLLSRLSNLQLQRLKQPRMVVVRSRPRWPARSLENAA